MLMLTRTKEDYSYIMLKLRPKAVQFFPPFLVEQPGRGGGRSYNNMRIHARAQVQIHW